MDLEQALARVAELEGQVTSLAGERDAAVALGEQLRGELGTVRTASEEAQLALSAANGAREAAEAALGEARTSQVAAVRRALLAEHAGQVVPELVAGDSAEALEASVAAAKAAHDRIAEATRAAIGATTVPAGAVNASAGAGAGAAADQSPLEKIGAGLAARSGS